MRLISAVSGVRFPAPPPIFFLLLFEKALAFSPSPFSDHQGIPEHAESGSKMGNERLDNASTSQPAAENGLPKVASRDI
jgi:hypothetical protein